MILLITKLQRGTNKAASGKVHEGLFLAGWKQNKDAPPEAYDKFLYDWKNAAHIQELEQIGLGSAALIKMVRNGRFWDIESIEEWRGGGAVAGEGDPNEGIPRQSQQQAAANAQSEATKTQDPLPAKAAGRTATEVTGKAFIAQSMTSDQMIRSGALRMSVDVVGYMLRSDPRFKKLLLVGTTSGLLGEILIDYAQRIEIFIRDGAENAKSDASELKKPKEKEQDPYAGEGDDPGINDGDEIPF